ncbi:MAG: flhF [Chlamydiales bacterium]|nr:flhF [Chlamydiales bacterium]
MIIKKYLANSLKDAEQLMRQELGSAAVILTTRQVKQKGLKRLFLSDQTELTATIERKDLEQFNAKKQKKEAPPLPKEAKKEARPMPREAKREEREELDDVVTLSASAKRQLSRPVEPALAPKKSAKREPVSSDPFGSASRNLISHFAEDLAHASEDKELQASIDEEVAHLAQLQELKDLKKLKQLEESEDLAELKDEADIDRLRHLIRAELKRAQESVSVGSLEQNEESLVGSVRFMMGKGIDRQIALDIERELEAAYPGVDMNAPSPERNARLNLLKEELAKRIRTSGPLILDRKEPTFVALVGPTGVGKTTAIVKLAHLHMKKGKKVGLISLDYTKVGARTDLAMGHIPIFNLQGGHLH